MMTKLSLGFLAVLSLAIGGCGSATSETSPDQATKQTTASDDAEKDHGHSHEGGDALVWNQEGLEKNGFSISLGHHGIRVLGGHAVEPAISITREGKAVADAKVFNSLISIEGEKVLAEEVATVYEPETEEEPSHYAQGALQVPEGLERVIIRYRIILPGDAVEVSFDDAVTVD